MFLVYVNQFSFVGGIGYKSICEYKIVGLERVWWLTLVDRDRVKISLGTINWNLVCF